MRWICSLALVGALAASPAARRAFPVPTLDGKPLAVPGDQNTFHLPQRMARVEAFYREHFAAEPKVTLSLRFDEGKRVLMLVSKRPGDSWAKAKVTESVTGTTVQITPVIELSTEHVEGNGRPLVEFIFSRSPEVDRMVQSIDHLEP